MMTHTVELTTQELWLLQTALLSHGESRLFGTIRAQCEALVRRLAETQERLS